LLRNAPQDEAEMNSLEGAAKPYSQHQFVKAVNQRIGPLLTNGWCICELTA
jgi:hypothetical protein